MIALIVVASALAYLVGVRVTARWIYRFMFLEDDFGDLAFAGYLGFFWPVVLLGIVSAWAFSSLGRLLVKGVRA